MNHFYLIHVTCISMHITMAISVLNHMNTLMLEAVDVGCNRSARICPGDVQVS